MARKPWWRPGMEWTRIDQRRFTSIWYRCGGLSVGDTVELAERRTPENLKYQRQQHYAGLHRKYPGGRERKWWLMVANCEDSSALL